MALMCSSNLFRSLDFFPIESRVFRFFYSSVQLRNQHVEFSLIENSNNSKILTNNKMYFRHTLTPLICLLFNNGLLISPFYSKFKNLKQKKGRAVCPRSHSQETMDQNSYPCFLTNHKVTVICFIYTHNIYIKYITSRFIIHTDRYLQIQNPQNI